MLDEYDVPLAKAKDSHGYYAQMLEIIPRSLFWNALKDKPFIKLFSDHRLSENCKKKVFLQEPITFVPDTITRFWIK